MTSQTKRRIISSVSLGVFVIAIVLLTVLFGDRLVDLVRDPESFRQTIDRMGWSGRLLFTCLIAAQVVLAVIPGQIFEVAGGFCFGAFEGVLWSSVGITIGSAIAFLLARFLGLRVITAFYSEEKLQKLFFLKESKRQIFIAFLIFLIPGIPKDMVAYFMGLTQMRLHVFLLISFLGRLPSLILAVLGGTAIQSKNLTMGIIVVVLILLFALLGFLFYRRQSKIKQQKNAIDIERTMNMKNVCFLGDSITRRGYWIAEIFEHLRKKGIRVWNCGVSGDSATRAIPRLYTDCLSRSPDTVVMMFGMNDVGRDLYDEGKYGDEIEAKKLARLKKFDTSVRTLVDMLKRAGCSVVLCTPTPCDDVTPGAAVVNHTNEGLARCAELVRKLAKELNLPCVDFFDHLLPRVGTEYQTLPDRVHPTPESHHPMAQLFLKTLGLIDAIDPTPFLPMNEDAQARFDVEQKAREIEFIEWNQMYEERKDLQKSHAELAALAKRRLAAARESGNEMQIRWYSNYLSIVGNRQLYEEELVRRTVEMANS